MATAKILPSRLAAIRRARPSTSTGIKSPAAISLDFRTATHSSYMGLMIMISTGVNKELLKKLCSYEKSLKEIFCY